MLPVCSVCKQLDLPRVGANLDRTPDFEAPGYLPYVFLGYRYLEDRILGTYSVSDYAHVQCLSKCPVCQRQKDKREFTRAYLPESEEWVDANEVNDDDEGAFLACANCADSNISECSDCDEYADQDSGISVNGHFKCESCASEYTSCAECGDYMTNDEAVYVDSEEAYYCSYHYDSLFFSCAGCETSFRISPRRGFRNQFTSRSGEDYCSSCYEDESSSDGYRDNDYTFYEAPPGERFPFKRHISLELEMEEGDPSDLEDSLSSRWGIKEDGSLHGPGARELNSPIMTGHMVTAEIEHACRVSKQCGYEATPACGTHIHVNAKDLTPIQLGKVARGYAVFEEVFTRLVNMDARGRWASYLVGNRTFGKAILTEVSTNWQLPSQTYGHLGYRFVRDHFLIDGERYRALNFTSLDRHGTVEWRLFEGSLERVDIEAMAYLVTAFIEGAKDWDSLPSRRFGGSRRFSHQFSELASALLLPEWVTTWMVKRYRQNGRKVAYLGATKWLPESEWVKEASADRSVWVPTDHTPQCRSCRQCKPAQYY